MNKVNISDKAKEMLKSMFGLKEKGGVEKPSSMASTQSNAEMP